MRDGSSDVDSSDLGVDEVLPRTTDERVRTIASSLKCPTCRSQSVADSDSAAARSIRTEIARRVDEGQSADHIRSAIAATYGDDVQLTPSGSGMEGLVWILQLGRASGRERVCTYV